MISLSACLPACLSRVFFRFPIKHTHTASTQTHAPPPPRCSTLTPVHSAGQLQRIDRCYPGAEADPITLPPPPISSLRPAPPPLNSGRCLVCTLCVILSPSPAPALRGPRGLPNSAYKKRHIGLPAAISLHPFNSTSLSTGKVKQVFPLSSRRTLPSHKPASRPRTSEGEGGLSGARHDSRASPRSLSSQSDDDRALTSATLFLVLFCLPPSLRCASLQTEKQPHRFVFSPPLPPPPLSTPPLTAVILVVSAFPRLSLSHIHTQDPSLPLCYSILRFFLVIVVVVGACAPLCLCALSLPLRSVDLLFFGFHCCVWACLLRRTCVCACRCVCAISSVRESPPPHSL